MQKKSYRAVGELLKSVRKKRGLRQRHAGDMMGVTYAYVSRIEKGEVQLRRGDMQERLAKFLGISTGALGFLLHDIPDELTGDDVKSYEKIREKITTSCIQ